jgi:hypothetical protein
MDEKKVPDSGDTDKSGFTGTAVDFEIDKVRDHR